MDANGGLMIDFTEESLKAIITAPPVIGVELSIGSPTEVVIHPEAKHLVYLSGAQGPAGIQGVPGQIGIPGSGGTATLDKAIKSDYSNTRYFYLGYAGSIKRFDHQASPVLVQSTPVANIETSWLVKESLIYI